MKPPHPLSPIPCDSDYEQGRSKRVFLLLGGPDVAWEPLWPPCGLLESLGASGSARAPSPECRQGSGHGPLATPRISPAVVKV